MKKAVFAGVALCAAMLLTGCSDSTARHQINKETRPVYHLSDGRYAYEDDGVWWYYAIMMQTNSATSASSTGLPVGGSWTKGVAPSAKELSEAEVENLEITEVDGEPAVEAEVAEAEASNEAADMADASVDAEAGADAGSDVSSADTGGYDGGGDAGGGDGGGGE